MAIADFSFRDHAASFDAHIGASIPGYEQLVWTCVRLSRRFVQSNTAVLDVGCSTGRLLAAIHEYNQSGRPDVSYVGIDSVPDFGVHWDGLKGENVDFQACDARSYRGFKNVSLTCCNFTMQFLPERDKMPLLKRIHEGLVEGGALMISEKTLAGTSRLQDALAFSYYDYKLEQGFTEKELLDKERNLRGLMTLWTESELRKALRRVGFREIEPIWRNFTFVGFLAIK